MTSETAIANPVKAVPFYRHSLLTRLTHWTNVIAFCVMLGSGLQIFNAHPALYWGQYGADDDNARRWLEIGAIDGVDGKPHGMTRIGPVSFDTSGVLGLSSPDGVTTAIGFPNWATIPSSRDLATGRRWHFFFAWVLVLNGLTYLGGGLLSGHLRKDLLPKLRELSPSHIAHDIWQHMRLKFPKGEDAKRYHILQKLSYSGVVFILLPAMVLSGLTMSPSNVATWDWLLDLFGGRQSARSVHFISASLLVAFIVVHLVMVLLAGPINEVRSMITGWFKVEPEGKA